MDSGKLDLRKIDVSIVHLITKGIVQHLTRIGDRKSHQFLNLILKNSKWETECIEQS